MKFDEAIGKIPNVTDLRRVARAHVVDHRQLSNEQLAAAIIKSKPQFWVVQVMQTIGSAPPAPATRVQFPSGTRLDMTFCAQLVA